MVPQTNAHPTNDDLKRDVQATLAARHELGTEYDDQFIASLVERLMRQARQEMANAPRARTGLSAEQRTAVAIMSVIFLIRLIAIAGGMFGPDAFALICLPLFAINVLALF